MVIKNLENKIKLVGIVCGLFLAGCIIISVASIVTARGMVSDAHKKIYVLDGNVPILDEGNDNMLDAQPFAMESGEWNLACVVVTTVVEGNGYGDTVLLVVEQGGGIHTAAQNQYRVFHFRFLLQR